MWRSDFIATAVFIRGLPGTGKSTIANFLQKSVKYEIIDPDLITTKDLCIYIIKNPKLLLLRNIKLLKYRYNLAKAAYIINCGQSLVWCQMFSSISGLRYTIKTLLKSCPQKIRLIVIDLVCDQKLLEGRSENKSWITKDKLIKLISSMENITGLNEGVPIYTINTNENPEITKNAVYRIVI